MNKLQSLNPLYSSPHGVIDWLTYRSYEFNRNRSPHIEPERWRAVYYNAELYEEIYQSQKGTTDGK